MNRPQRADIPATVRGTKMDLAEPRRVVVDRRRAISLTIPTGHLLLDTNGAETPPASRGANGTSRTYLTSINLCPSEDTRANV